MIPRSANKIQTKSHIEKKHIFNITSDEEEELNYDINENEINENENNEYYSYINSERVNHIKKPYNSGLFIEYKGLEYLIKEKPNVNTQTNVYICAYNINQTGKKPFLQFMLKKYPEYMFDDMVTFPYFTYFGDNENVLDECSEILNKILLIYNKEEKYNYHGYLKQASDLYVFYDISDYDINLQELSRVNLYWLVLPDEIINHGSICGFRIDNHVTNFFMKNTIFNFLYDNDGSKIEMPIVAYNGMHSSMLYFTSIFGILKSGDDSIAGPYYYFTSFNKAFEKGGWSKDGKPEFKYDKKITAGDTGRYDKGGIIRFALFAGLTNVPLNHPDDEIDESEFKKRIIDDDLRQYAVKTMRVSDHCGNWTKDYDSIYIGRLELDDGSILEDAPYWVMKQYEQQTPLSIHHIDKRALGEVWKSDVNYLIK